MSRSAGPFTGAPAMIGLTPTTRSRRRRSTSRTPGTARTGPIEITGFDGQISTVAAASSASSTPGAGRAASAPSKRTDTTGGSARSRTNHSCMRSSLVPPSAVRTVIRVETGSSVMGTSRLRTPQARVIAPVAALSVAPERSISVRKRWVARSRSPRRNQVGTP
jgi:hypothetical protein